MTSIYSPEMQRIRLPSVNDIFPHGSSNDYIQQTSKPIIISPIPVPHNHHSQHAVIIPYHQQSYISPIQPNYTIHYQDSIHHPMTPIGLTGSPTYTTHPTQHYTNSPSPSATYFAPVSSNNINRYRVSKQTTRQSNAWSYEDDCLLKYLKEVRNLGWREISMHFKNRTANGCQFRWRRIVALAKSAESVSTSPAQKIAAQDEVSSPTSAISSRSNSLESLLN